jgi:hypothetical protein
MPSELTDPVNAAFFALPDICVRALLTQRAQQDIERHAAGEQSQETGLVFTTRLGTAMGVANVRRNFRRAVAPVPGLDSDQGTPRELRHSFVQTPSSPMDTLSSDSPSRNPRADGRGGS